jgi:hypothetical protein
MTTIGFILIATALVVLSAVIVEWAILVIGAIAYSIKYGIQAKIQKLMFNRELRNLYLNLSEFKS